MSVEPPPAAAVAALDELYRDTLQNVQRANPTPARAADYVEYFFAKAISLVEGKGSCCGSIASPIPDALLSAIRHLDYDTMEEPLYFFRCVVPCMVDAVRNYVDVMRSAALVCGAADTLLTKRQCFCVLSAAFFCLYERDAPWGDSRQDLPPINFSSMHLTSARASSGSVVTKLRMLLDYFCAMSRRISNGDACLDDIEDGLRILRRSAEPATVMTPEKLTVVLREAPPPTFHPLRVSIDEQTNMSRIDFANKYIGGGSIGHGCVQEEITFTMYPELNVSRLFHPPMHDKEAIVLINAERFSSIRPGTYGRTTQYGGRYDGPRVRGEVFVAVDALMMFRDSLERQRSPELVQRELVKFVAGLRAIPSSVPESQRNRIATGNWGCGAFGGDVQVKLLIQWIACAMEGREMHYFPFDQQCCVDFGETLAKTLCDRGVTTGKLLQWIESSSYDSRDLWDVIAERAAAAATEQGTAVASARSSDGADLGEESTDSDL